MPTRFDKYRVKDGLTRLGEGFFNPVFQDIDLRISSLESLRVSWETAVDVVTQFGLLRINEVIGPAAINASAMVEQIEGSRQSALASIAALQVSIDAYEAAAAADIQTWKNGVTNGITVLNATVATAQSTVASTLTDLQASVDAAEAAALADIATWKASVYADIAALATSVSNAETSAIADINTWKAARLAELDAWRATLTAELPGIDARLDALEAALPGLTAADAALDGRLDVLEGQQLAFVGYDNRANLRAGTPAQDRLTLLDGIGLFRFVVGSDEPDDDESCFATSNGRWLLECPHWDLVDAWRKPDQDEIDSFMARVLKGSAACSITSVAAGSQVSFTTTVVGAQVGDVVIATPPDALNKYLAIFALVSACDTVTIYLNNPSASSATLVAGIWTLRVFKEF